MNNCTFQDQLLRQVGPELKQRIWLSNDISLRKQRNLRLVGKWNDYWLILFSVKPMYFSFILCVFMSMCAYVSTWVHVCLQASIFSRMHGTPFIFAEFFSCISVEINYFFIRLIILHWSRLIELKNRPLYWKKAYDNEFYGTLVAIAVDVYVRI